MHYTRETSSEITESDILGNNEDIDPSSLFMDLDFFDDEDWEVSPYEKLESFRSMSLDELREECERLVIPFDELLSEGENDIALSAWKKTQHASAFSISGLLMPGEVSMLSGDQIEQEFMGEKPIILDFFAKWCGPCKMIEPHLEAAASDLSDKCRVIKIDCEKDHSWVSKYNVEALPTLLVLQNGKEVNRIMGAFAKDRILEAAEPFL